MGKRAFGNDRGVTGSKIIKMNHCITRTCAHCGTEFCLRCEWGICPTCGREWIENNCAEIKK